MLSQLLLNSHIFLQPHQLYTDKESHPPLQHTCWLHRGRTQNHSVSLLAAATHGALPLTDKDFSINYSSATAETQHVRELTLAS